MFPFFENMNFSANVNKPENEERFYIRQVLRFENK